MEGCFALVVRKDSCGWIKAALLLISGGIRLADQAVRPCAACASTLRQHGSGSGHGKVCVARAAYGLSCYPDLQCSRFATCRSKAQHTTSQGGCACSRAQLANASGVLISAAAGGDAEVMTCRGEECGLPLSIPAAMIPLSAALQLQVGGIPQPVGLRLG